jgi:outer membrane protein
MTTWFGTRLLAVAVLAGSLSPGCTTPEQHRYETIKSEYGATGVRNERTETGPQPLPTSQKALGGPITLADAVKTALDHNPDMRIAAARIEQARADTRKAQAAFYPQLGFYTEYTHADAPSVYLFKTIDQRRLAPDTDFNRPGVLNNFESGLSARYTLYNAGRDTLARQVAETGLAITEWQRQEVENTLIATVIRAYYDALAAEDFIRIATESVTTVEKELEIMRVRYDGGGALRSDLLSLEVRLAQSREDVVRSRNRHRLALSALATVMGMSPEITLDLQPVAGLRLDMPRRFDAGVRYGLAHRPEIQKMRQQVRSGRMALDRSRSSRWPTIDLSARYYLDDENLSYDLERDNWAVAVLFNWDIFTGFSSEADEAKAQGALRAILAADTRTDLVVKQDIKNAYLNLEAATARMAVARQSVASADESLALVQRQFEGGGATITRYLEAELDRNRARIRATAASHDQQKALADIGRAIGYWGKVKAIP